VRCAKPHGPLSNGLKDGSINVHLISSAMLNIDSILLARDFSPVSDQAFRYSLDLARRTGATLHVLHAQVLHEDPDTASTSSLAADVDRIKTQLSQYGNGDDLEGRDAEVEVVEAVVRDVAAGPAILNYADHNDIDVIALGTHGRRGVRRFLLGSVAEEVVRRADRPVLTVRGSDTHEPANVPPLSTLDRILVPIDFSDPSREALLHAHELATLFDATVDVFHVVQQTMHPAFYVGGITDIRDIDPNIEEKVKTRMREFIEETLRLPQPAGGPSESSLETGRVVPHMIIGAVDTEVPAFIAEQGTDLVVMSTKGQTGLDRVLLGSVAEKIVRIATCPVLTVKAGAHSLVS